MEHSLTITSKVNLTLFLSYLVIPFALVPNLFGQNEE